ncbi:hypothetical protein C9J85_07965 [Haloferax sp. wsp5]|nr:hypothetical protein C9J85_07965 [Haloferax sp. wsp5]
MHSYRRLGTSPTEYVSDEYFECRWRTSLSRRDWFSMPQFGQSKPAEPLRSNPFAGVFGHEQPRRCFDGAMLVGRRVRPCVESMRSVVPTPDGYSVGPPHDSIYW